MSHATTTAPSPQAATVRRPRPVWLAVVLARYARHPARAYLRATLALTALSLAVPLSAADTATSTKVMLACAHLLAAAIVIPAVTRRLAGAPGRGA